MIYNSQAKVNEKRLAIELTNLILREKENLVFVCVGSDKIVGDCLSPIVGEKLRMENMKNAVIYGDLTHPITYTNLTDVLKQIKCQYPKSKVVIIDSVLGDASEIGCVKFEKGGIVIGGEYQKGVYSGDYYIVGVVNTRGITSLTFLKSVKLKNVVKMADFIFNSIRLAYKYCLVM